MQNFENRTLHGHPCIFNTDKRKIHWKMEHNRVRCSSSNFCKVKVKRNLIELAEHQVKLNMLLFSTCEASKNPCCPKLQTVKIKNFITRLTNVRELIKAVIFLFIYNNNRGTIIAWSWNKSMTHHKCFRLYSRFIFDS